MTDAEFYASENARLQAEWETMRVERDRLLAALANTEEIARQLQVPRIGSISDYWRGIAEKAVAVIKRGAGLESGQ